MQSLDEILNMWDIDSEIDDNHLDASSIKTAKLHSKYLKILINAKMRKSKIDIDFNSLKKIKIKYYRGEMTREELAERNWVQYQYNKPLKNEMEEFLKGDDDLNKLLQRQQYVDNIIYATEAILAQLKQRDWQIRNSITWKTFLAGN